MTFLIDEAGTPAWTTTFDRIRARLRNMGLDTVAPWNEASTAREALFETFGKVLSAYRERQGSSFWAATN